ncbi:MAG: F0F1 ATP synthase subunit B [Phycisphaeraceae bacterium]|nr:F0F1 ATP synthase subunit B [Phycisphaeraceae bacterium]
MLMTLRRSCPILLVMLCLLAAPAGLSAAAETHEAPAPDQETSVTATDPHGEASVHEQEQMPFLLSVDLGSAVWNMVVFLLLLLFLAKFVWPSILGGLRQREEKIRGDLDAAAKASAEAKATLDQYHQQLTAARQEAQQIIEQSRTDAQKVADQLKKDAHAEITHMRKRAEADIRAAGEQAIATIYEQAAGLSTSIAGRILQREIDPAAHQALVDQSLQQLQAEQN